MMPPTAAWRRRVKIAISDKAARKLWHTVWHAIHRCSRSDYPNYGKRGIKVCQEWMDDPVLFFEHLLSLPGCDDAKLLIDRKDNNGDYEPGNLRFVTKSESNSNKRGRGLFDADDVLAIRLEYQRGKTQREIANARMVGLATINNVLNGRGRYT